MNVRRNSTDIDLHNAFETFLKYRNVSRMLIFEVVQIFVAKKHEDVGCVKLFNKKNIYVHCTYTSYNNQQEKFIY